MEHEIKFLNPGNLTIPTDLCVEVDGIKVNYKRINGGFHFDVLTDSNDKANDIIQILVNRMIMEHDESQHGVSWRTVSFGQVDSDWPFEKSFNWFYRVRDSY